MRTHGETCRRRRTGTGVLVLLLSSLCAGHAYAQVQTVDREHIQADTRAWIKQWAQWKQQFDQWEQQYFTLLNVVKTGPAFLNSGELKRRDPQDGLAQRCPEPGVAAGQIAQQQNVFCRMLLEIDNNRYNVLVDLNQQMHRRSEEMQTILASRITDASSKDLGGLRAFNAEMQSFQANVEHDMSNAKAALDQYASISQAIKDQQAQLTEQAFKSAPSGVGSGLVGGLIQGATLKGALETAKHW